MLRCAAGHIVYFGEREGVMPFFNSCGFALPARKGIADFLQEVTSRKDQGVRQPFLPSLVPPEFHHAKDLLACMFPEQLNWPH